MKSRGVSKAATVALTGFRAGRYGTNEEGCYSDKGFPIDIPQ
jgi:hypothetical protein